MNNKYYSYGFDVLLSKNSIKAEWLYELNKNGDERKIFVREINKDIDLNEEYFTDKIFLERLKIYAMDIQNQDNVLFLTVMNKNNLYQDRNNSIVIFKDIYNWFEQVLVVILPEGKMIDDSYYVSEENLEKITEIVSKFGTGISKCKIEPIKLEELSTRIPPQISSDVIKFTEQNYMNADKQNKSRIILATSTSIGEGFDDSRLDTLFLTMPVSWKGRIIQYVGRLHREHIEKNKVIVYDYLDNMKVLDKMYNRRLKGYKVAGYEIIEK